MSHDLTGQFETSRSRYGDGEFVLLALAAVGRRRTQDRFAATASAHSSNW